ncbi:MAG: transposase, partial [Anaeroplasmataceae bacterium]|nr:transposase [Anaeroplasmataceae bacterium]
MNNKLALKTRFFENRYAHKGSFLYVIQSCSYCRLKKYCQANLKEIKNYRIFDVNYNYSIIKKNVTQNLLSPKGIEMRVNRSSQVEGAFGVIKQDMDYDRTRRRGLLNVSLEFMLICLGYNIRKLFSLIEGKAKTDYWIPPAD